MSDIVATFWSQTERRSANECWPWIGSTIKKDGRGTIRLNGKTVVAPRLAWRVKYGRWPPQTQFVCHSCDNPNCVNPNHLWLGDHKSNARDAAAKGRLHMQKHPERSFFATPASNKFRPRGNAHGMAVLDEADARWIKDNYKPRHPTFGGRAMARTFNVHKDTIYGVLRGRTWRAA